MRKDEENYRRGNRESKLEGNIESSKDRKIYHITP